MTMSIFSRKIEQRVSLETFKIIIREADVKLKRFLTTIVLAGLATLFLPATHSQAYAFLRFMEVRPPGYKYGDKIPTNQVFLLPGYGYVRVIFAPAYAYWSTGYKAGYSVEASNHGAGPFIWAGAPGIGVQDDNIPYNIDYIVKFRFLSGEPDWRALVLLVANVGWPTTATVSQPVYGVGELKMYFPPY